MPTPSVHLFGMPRIERDGAAVAVERRKSLALLAYLAVTRQPHGRDALATLLWPDFDAERARAALRRTLVDLNAALGKGWIEAEGDQIGLAHTSGVCVDVRSFRDAVIAVARHGHGRAPARSGDRICVDCLAELGRAADLYRGDFLAGFTLPDAAEFDTWQTCQTETFRLELAEALEMLAESYAAGNEPSRGLPHARRWLSLDPLCEPAHHCLMRLYAAAGDRHAAFQQYTACQEALRKELGIPPEPETSALYERIKAGLLTQHTPAGGDAAPPPLAHSPAPAHTLPSPTAAFFGREVELALITTRLADPACRLLTILGPGGSGKTSLALQAAAALNADTARFPAGVCFVPLAGVTSAELISPAILQALGVPPRSSMDPQRQLIEHLADRRMLLALDNFEHLLGDEGSGIRDQEAPDGVGLLVEMLAGAPGVKLLVTSRERLNLRDEWLLPLGGLALPPDDQHSHCELRAAWPSQAEAKQSPASGEIASSHRDAAQSQTPLLAVTDSEADLLAEPTPAPPDLAAHAATQLFLHCARRVRPDLQPDADAARLIAHICRLVDGLPLAIELTAPWVRALPLAEIARRLEAGLDLLATTQRDVPARHRSMRAAFDHSWRLLSGHERSILRQLGVFRGGCTAEAAEAVAGATLLDLTGLTDKSWLRVESSGRYDLHELVRQYCAEKLAAEHEREAGETPDQVHDRHCAYFASLAAPYERIFQPPRKSDRRELIPELDNLYVAWLRAIERRDAEQLRQLLPFALVNELLGRNRVMLQFFETSFERLRKAWEQEQDADRAPTTTLILAYICWGKAGKHVSLDQWAEVLAATETGLAFLERADRCALWQASFVFSRLLRALAISHLGEPAEADRLLCEVSGYLDQADARRWLTSPEVTLPRWRADVNTFRGNTLPRLGHYAESLRVNEEALAYHAKTGQMFGFSTAWNGYIRSLQGDFGEARRRVQATLDAWQASGHGEMISVASAFLAEIEAATGEVVPAREHFRRSLAIARAIDRNGLVCFSLEGLGRLELEMGRPERAAELYRQSLTFIEQTGMVRDYHTPIALAGMGRAALAMGNRGEAKDYQRRALRCPVYWVHDRIEAVATLAQVFAAEGDVLRAVELLAFAVAHPATAHRVRQPIARLLAELEAELPAEQFAAAAARGRARQIDEVVAELAGERPADRQASVP